MQAYPPQSNLECRRITGWAHRGTCGHYCMFRHELWPTYSENVLEIPFHGTNSYRVGCQTLVDISDLTSQDTFISVYRLIRFQRRGISLHAKSLFGSGHYHTISLSALIVAEKTVQCLVLNALLPPVLLAVILQRSRSLCWLCFGSRHQDYFQHHLIFIHLLSYMKDLQCGISTQLAASSLCAQTRHDIKTSVAELRESRDTVIQLALCASPPLKLFCLKDRLVRACVWELKNKWGNGCMYVSKKQRQEMERAWGSNRENIPHL